MIDIVNFFHLVKLLHVKYVMYLHTFIVHR